MKIRVLILLAAMAVCLPRPAAAQPTPSGLAHERFVLENGLTVIVHENHVAPVVTVGVWYHVGSRNEPEGRTGFAHLFEHLMFNGSENNDGEWFKAMQAIGATGINGTTSLDRTNYYQTAPTPALDRLLWMESDRMGHLLGAVTQAKLDEQRAVVQNEKRQADNVPYGRVNYDLYGGLFPEDHPYHHPTIGSMADLDAASLDAVRDWFRTFYGPNNAVLVISGDVTLDDVRGRVERYFGDIPPGPEVDGWTALTPARQDDTYAVQYDTAPAALANRAWAGPGFEQRERALLELAVAVLGSGRDSRLSRELIHERQVASNIDFAVNPYELSSVVDLAVTLNPGQAAGVANEAMDRVIADFLETGPTEDELNRARMRFLGGYLRALENPRSLAAVLAEGELYADDSGFIDRYLDWIRTATPADVRDASRRYLADGFHQVSVVPAQTLRASAAGVDRSLGLPPPPEASPELSFPALETATLANGLRIVVAPRRTIPVVELTMLFDAGGLSDADGAPGLSAFAMGALTKGTPSRTDLEIAAEQERLGAGIAARSGPDVSRVILSALSEQLAPSIVLWADVIRNADYAADAVERYRNEQSAAIAQEEANPISIAQRLLPLLAYGEGHPYARSMTGTIDRRTLERVRREDLVRYKTTWLRPDNATLFVAGDTSLQEILPLLEAAFADWRSPSAPLARAVVQPVERPSAPRVILIDQPGAEQSYIHAGHVAPGGMDPESRRFGQAATVLGGGFNARINMNLREDKGWSYGAYDYLLSRRVQSLFVVVAPVQTDQTGASLRELMRELSDINGSRPIAADEFEASRQDQLRKLPASLQSVASVLSSMTFSAIDGRPPNDIETLDDDLRAMTLEQVREAARELVHPESLVWIIVGDRAKIEAEIAALSIAPIEHYTASGEPIPSGD